MLKNRAAIKSVAIYLRMTAKDKAAIEERAKERKMTVTEYLTRTGLARLTRQRADVDAIHQLCLCVEELKGIHRALQLLPTEAPMIDPATLEQTMQEICAAIQRIWRKGERGSFPKSFSTITRISRRSRN